MIVTVQALSNLKPPAILSISQVVERLNAIPGFILVNATGQALTVQPPDGKGRPTVGVFLRSQAAQEFREGLLKQDPKLASVLKVKVIRLGELYQLAQKPEERTALTFVPDKAEVAKAQEVLKLQGKPDKVIGVPLFMAELPGKGLLNVTQNGKSIIPVFFSQADLIPMVERYNKVRPADAPEARIALTTLEFLVESWPKAGDPALLQMQLVVNKTVFDEVKALAGGS
jgi:Tic22-like family